MSILYVHHYVILMECLAFSMSHVQRSLFTIHMLKSLRKGCHQWTGRPPCWKFPTLKNQPGSNQIDGVNNLPMVVHPKLLPVMKLHRQRLFISLYIEVSAYKLGVHFTLSNKDSITRWQLQHWSLQEVQKAHCSECWFTYRTPEEVADRIAS